MTSILEDLNKNSPPFQPDISYNFPSYEQKVANLSSVGIKKEVLFYQFKTDNNPEKCRIKLYPDACLNILVDCDNGIQSLISGPALSQQVLELSPCTQYFGFKPYSILGLKAPNIDLVELVGIYAKLSDVYSHLNELVEAMNNSVAFYERINCFNQFAKNSLIDYDYEPSFVDYFSIMICSSKGNIHFNEQFTGYSERYCRLKFKNYQGLSPKQYGNIMRFQNSIKDLLSHRYNDLSSLAYENGYFDQAHFIRDFRKFTNCSPTEFLKQSN